MSALHAVNAVISSGCVIREPDVFMPFYKEFIVEKKELPENFRG